MENALIYKIDTEKAFIELNNDNIFIVYYKNNVEINKDDVAYYKTVFDQWVKDESTVKLLSIAGIGTSITKEAREFSEKLNLPVKREALVITSLAQRLIANFYLKIISKVRKTAVFENKKEAIEWLLKG